MRYGFTTGSCAAAAAKAAAYMLLTGKIKNCITIETPKGIPYTAEVTDIVRGESQVSCAVVKDGGCCWDIGYCIHPTCWRKGYAKEMVNALVQFGAQNGIKTVLADVAAENAGSCGVMRALGFTPTENGTFRRSGSQTEYKSLTFKKQL